MDLRTVKEDLLGGNYETPMEFCKDMRLIFQNSRNYNTNKRSRVNSNTYNIKSVLKNFNSVIVTTYLNSQIICFDAKVMSLANFKILLS